MNGEELRIVRSMRSEHCPRFIVLLIGYKGHKLGVSTSLDGVISSSGKGFLFRKGGGGSKLPFPLTRPVTVNTWLRGRAQPVIKTTRYYGEVISFRNGVPAHDAFRCQFGLSPGRSLVVNGVVVQVALHGSTNSAAVYTTTIPVNQWRRATSRGHGRVTRRR